MKRTLAGLILVSAAASAATITADSGRGAKLFETLSCIECHSVNGRGGKIAPDLSRHIDRDLRPAALAATMWNHAPTMWAAIKERNIKMGPLDQQGAADLFAYFYASGFFDKPGDAGRGKQVFSSKHCSECHGTTEAKLPGAKPLSQWEATSDPIALANAMWNHASTMQGEFAKRKFAWPQMTSQDLADLLVYVRNLPGGRTGAEGRIEITAGANGEALFKSKGCSECHSGKLALGPLLKGMTLTDIAAAMWDHEPKMPKTPPQLSVDEMRELISYLWAKQFFQDSGNPGAGAKVFASKNCAGCHKDAMAIPGGDFNASVLISALWRHGPQMLAEMSNRHVAWPHLEAKQMADLIAYLNSRKQ
jgi:mono/diheme cytochrome c family protein